MADEVLPAIVDDDELEASLTPAERAARDKAEGRMSLGEHIAELRSRLIKSVIAIVAMMVLGLVIYHPLLNLLTRPFTTAVMLEAHKRGLDPQLTMTGVADPLTFQMKISFTFGVAAACPIWLYQLWAFIAPGLHRHEKKWAYLFSLTATPMFVLGVVVAYWTLPKGLQVLIGFTPKGVQNLIELPHYLDFTLRTMVLFGVSFQLPLIILFLAWRGIVGAEALKKARPYMIVGIFVFAAVATPSGDPVTMCMLAIPITVLYLVAEVIARRVAKREAVKARKADRTGETDLEVPA